MYQINYAKKYNFRSKSVICVSKLMNFFAAVAAIMLKTVWCYGTSRPFRWGASTAPSFNPCGSLPSAALNEKTVVQWQKNGWICLHFGVVTLFL